MSIATKPELTEVNGKRYKVKNGTFFHEDTPDKVIDWLETSKERKQRIRIFYGKDNKCWNEEFDVIGHVDRSTGTTKIPLLIKSARSYGGGAIMDDRIVRIDTKCSNGNIVTVYIDNTIQFDHFSTQASAIPDYATMVYNDTKKEVYGHCKSEIQGKHLADFMNGKRWTK